MQAKDEDRETSVWKISFISQSLALLSSLLSLLLAADAAITYTACPKHRTGAFAVMWRLLFLSLTALALVDALPASETRAACSSYKQVYSGTKTVNGHGSETVTVQELGSLGLGRVYLPGPDLVNAGTAAVACKAACSLGINGQNCLSTVVYQ